MIKPEPSLGWLLRSLSLLNDALVYDGDPRPALRQIHWIAEQAYGGESDTAASWPEKEWSFAYLWKLTFVGGDVLWWQTADYCDGWLRHLNGEAA